MAPVDVVPVPLLPGGGLIPYSCGLEMMKGSTGLAIDEACGTID